MILRILRGTYMVSVPDSILEYIVVNFLTHNL
jgi:hypothetical protein